MLVTKATGEQEEFDRGKLERSLRRAGAEDDSINDIVTHIEQELHDGDTTTLIYKHAHDMLTREKNTLAAARYSLRRAILDLGPSGYAFEEILGEIFRLKGYSAEVGVTLSGKCVSHEIDVVAELPDSFVAVEAKFHNQAGFKTDVKVALYVKARFDDLMATQFDGRKNDAQTPSFWLVTNTKFTHHAIDYGTCAGLHLVGWNYPEMDNLQDMIEATGLHPLTCLPSLTQKEKQLFFDQGIVLCRSIKDNPELLKRVGLNDAKAGQVLADAQKLCVPRGIAGATV